MFMRLRHIIQHKVAMSERHKAEIRHEAKVANQKAASEAGEAVADLSDFEENKVHVIKLIRQDIYAGVAIFIGCMFAVFLMVGWQPNPFPHELHRTKLHRYNTWITSPLYEVSAGMPLVLGGAAGGPLAPGTTKACIDLKMLLPCTAWGLSCRDPSGSSGHRRRLAEARTGLRRLTSPPSQETELRRYLQEHKFAADEGELGASGKGAVTPLHNVYAQESADQGRQLSSGQGNTADVNMASVLIQLWAGSPSSANSTVWYNKTVLLEPYRETEFFDTIWPTDPSTTIFITIHVTDSQSAPHHYGLLVQTVELSHFASYRVLYAGLLFLLIFGLILSEVINRVFSTMVGVVLCLGLNSLVYNESMEMSHVMEHVDWGTLILLFSMMINVHLLSLTGFFEFIAVRVASMARGNAVVVFFLLSMMAGLLSAFLDNVTCVMLLGPVTISLCKQMKVPSVPFYLTQTICATIGGTATLVGDPPNVVIAFQLGLPFMSFIVYNGPLVCILLPIAACVQYYRFRVTLRAAETLTPEKIQELKDANPIIDEPTLLYIGVVLCSLFIALFLTEVHHVEPAFYCLLAMLASSLLISRHSIRHLLESVEWDTLLFFLCLFIIVEMLAELGLIRAIGDVLTTIISSVSMDARLEVACLLFLWVSALGSAFFESLPYTTTISAILLNLGEGNTNLGIPTEPLAWALSVGACVGGIGSIMGSSANLVALGVSHRYSPEEAIEGKHFLQYGLPLLFVLTTIASIYHYVIFGVFEFTGTI